MTTTDRPALSLAELEAFDPHPAGAGAERRFCCPLPGCQDKPRDRAHQSLCANVESGAWLCNRCGATGKLAERWEARPRLTGAQRRREVARRAFALPPEPPGPGRADSAPLLAPLLETCVPVARTSGQRYLFDRGIGLGVVTPAGVLFTLSCYGRPGVVFPMHDRAGLLVAVNVRHTDGRTDPKTHSVGDRSLGVFATPGALAVDAPLVIVEGPMDALSLATCDVPAIALACTRAPHWLRTAAAFRHVLVALDADSEGDEKAELLASELAPSARRVDRLRPPMGKDWNDALMADYVGLCEWLEKRCA